MVGRVRRVSGGETHTIVLAEDAGVFKVIGFGNNLHFQLGQKQRVAYHIHVLVMKSPNIKDIYTGGTHSLVLMRNVDLV